LEMASSNIQTTISIDFLVRTPKKMILVNYHLVSFA
jgi:hypothetical protein